MTRVLCDSCWPDFYCTTFFLNQNQNYCQMLTTSSSCPLNFTSQQVVKHWSTLHSINGEHFIYLRKYFQERKKPHKTKEKLSLWTLNNQRYYEDLK